MIDKIKLLKAFVAILVVTISTRAAYSQYYLLTTYESSPNTIFNLVYLKMLDLQAGVVQESLFLSNEGTIYTPNPICLKVGQAKYYLILLSKGQYDKNTAVGRGKVFWWIINITEHINIMSQDSIINAYFSTVENYSNDTYFGFGIANDTSGTAILDIGNYNLTEDFGFRKIDSFKSYNRKPDRLPPMNSFKEIKALYMPNTDYYFAYGPNNNSWILKTDSTKSTIMDSIQIESNIHMSELYAYHPVKNKIYAFSLNFERHGGNSPLNKGYGENWGIPLVVIYDPLTLSEIRRDTLTDFVEGEYPGLVIDRADVVGDFIVYYFFEQENLSQEDPAMLFIFDTRTNEARWLRVGWR